MHETIQKIVGSRDEGGAQKALAQTGRVYRQAKNRRAGGGRMERQVSQLTTWSFWHMNQTIFGKRLKGTLNIIQITSSVWWWGPQGPYILIHWSREADWKNPKHSITGWPCDMRPGTTSTKACFLPCQMESVSFISETCTKNWEKYCLYIFWHLERLNNSSLLLIIMWRRQLVNISGTPDV